MNPLTLNPIHDLKQLVSALIDDAKIEAQIAALNIALDADKAAAAASQSFLESKIAELRAQLKPL